MKEGLTLHVQGSSANGSIVAADIIPLRQRRKTRSLALELGKAETIPNVADGRYVVRLRLSNGGLVAKNIEVKNGRGEETFRLDDTFSPNETAAWGYLLHPARRSLSSSALKTLGRKFDSPGSILDSGLAFDPMLPSTHDLRRSFHAELFLQEVRQPELPSSRLSLHPVRPQEVGWERLTGQYSATADPNVVAEFSSSMGSRRMPVLMMADPQQDPLRKPDSPMHSFALLPPQTARLLVIFDPAQDQKRDMSSPWNLMPDIGDSHAMVLYSYLSAGRFSQARVIADQYLSHAIRALEGKFNNLTAAIIGGYYLLKMTPPWARKRSKIGGISAAELTEWVDNLDRHFGHCADGAIINASQHLRCGRLPQARERLLEAIRRGMPFSTLGARMLMDGLKLMSESENGWRDTELESAVNRLRPLYASIDWKSPFTTVRGRLASGPHGPVIEPAGLFDQKN